MTTTKDIDLTGKNALITGSARGLGKVMAQGLISAGANVAVLDIDKAEAEATAAELNGMNSAGKAIALTCDISDIKAAEAAIKETISAFGRLDILVNNAAKGTIHIEQSPKSKSAKFYEADPIVWQDVVVTNVNGAFYMSHFAAQHMVANGWGRIVNVTTSLRSLQRGSNSPYGVSKAAIESETLIFAKDLEGTGVTVNTILPGGAADTTFVSLKTRRAIEASGRNHLLSPEVMFYPIIWLASEHSNAVSGKRIVGMHWDPDLDLDAAAEKAIEGPAITPVPDDAEGAPRS